MALKVAGDYADFDAEQRQYVFDGMLNEVEAMERCSATTNSTPKVFGFGMVCISGLEVPSILMELAPSGSLSQLIRPFGLPSCMSRKDARQLITKVLNILDSVHQAGVIHRDLKAANILLSEPPCGKSVGSIKLTDFGASRIVRGINDFPATRGVGTEGWEAPELRPGSRFKHDSRVDSYGVGALLVEVRFGYIPFWYVQPWCDDMDIPADEKAERCTDYAGELKRRDCPYNMERDIPGWVKLSRFEKKFLDLCFKPKEERCTIPELLTTSYAKYAQVQ